MYVSLFSFPRTSDWNTVIHGEQKRQRNEQRQHCKRLPITCTCANYNVFPFFNASRHCSCSGRGVLRPLLSLSSWRNAVKTIKGAVVQLSSFWQSPPQWLKCLFWRHYLKGIFDDQSSNIQVNSLGATYDIIRSQRRKNAQERVKIQGMRFRSMSQVLASETRGLLFLPASLWYNAARWRVPEEK